MQKNGELILDEEEGRPCSRITSEMGVDVEEYTSSYVLGLGGDDDTDDDAI